MLNQMKPKKNKKEEFEMKNIGLTLRKCRQSLRPTRNVEKPKRYNDYIMYANYCSAVVSECYEAVINSQELSKWKDAMNREIRSLEESETWTVINMPLEKIFWKLNGLIKSSRIVNIKHEYWQRDFNNCIRKMKKSIHLLQK